MKLEKNIEKHTINIKRLYDGVQSQKEGVEQNLLMEKGILAELEEIDLRLFKMVTRLKGLQNRMVEQEDLIRLKEIELYALKEKRQHVQAHLLKRMTAYYKLGKIDLINITFSTKTLPELLRFHDSFQSVIEYDQEIINEYRNSIEALESVREAFTLEKGLLEEFIVQAAEEQEAIVQARKIKEKLLTRVRTQAKLHQQAIKELEQAKDELTVTLKQLKDERMLYVQGFLYNKGKHIPPVNGEIISLFGQESTNRFGITRKPQGIALEAPDGTKVRSIFAGKVIYAGYLRGYGNTIIIDHGYNYYTITSRLERILVSKGKKLRRSDIVGIMGATATLLDEGLYFEIRLGDDPLDPLPWLNREKLTFKKVLQEKG